jgi:hypothetical protein
MEGRSMKTNHSWLKRIPQFGLLLMVGISMTAKAGLFGFGGDSWKEEVLLHDGSKMIVDRSLERGGRHEIGQRSGATNETLTFTMPGTNQAVTWKDSFSKDIGSSNFNLLMLDILDGTAYLVASPMGCLSYNKWGRPNPPYVVFKYQGESWQRIELKELPEEFKTPNLIISSPDVAAEKSGHGVISSDAVRELNSHLRQPEFRSILREPMVNGNGCLIPTNARAEPIGPLINGEVLYYNWWPLAKDWLKSKYGNSKQLHPID